MIYKFLILFILNLADTIDVPYFRDVKINLDGKLNEEVYKDACKIMDLVQTQPVPFQNPPDSTTVFIFQTEKGLYVGFHCATKGREPDRSSMGDEVSLLLDTNLDRENACLFKISANGEKSDARIFSGERFDYNADFLWEGKVYCGKNYFEVEIFVPWKGLIGKKGKWGIDIVREWPGGAYEARLSPFDPKKEKFHVSRFKVIKMINFKVKLITTEIQPVFLLHHGEDFGEKYNYKYEIGLNTYLKFKENLKFVFTFNPDFGEVEADPFRLNLSKYPLYYSETRPFFTEGSEFFKLSGRRLFFNVFYSRQIGKTLPSGKTIPISFAEKFFIKSNSYEFSLLHAQTKKTEDIYTIPRADFLVNKIRIKPDKNFSISLLGTYKLPYNQKTKGLIGSQFFYNDSITTIDIESVFDNYVSHDFAQRAEFEKKIKKLQISAGFLSIPDNFSDNEVGYIPWRGEKKLNFELSRSFLINKKILYFTPSLGFEYYKELGEPYVFTITSGSSLTFSNLMHFYLSVGYKKDFELNNAFESPIFNLSIMNLFLKLTKNKFLMFISAYATKVYNYQRNYIGWTNNNSISGILNIKNLTVITTLYQWNEFSPDKRLEASTYSLYLTSHLNLPHRVGINFYCNIPVQKGSVSQERVGIFISWNPSRKDYIKTIYNDYRVKDENDWIPLIKKGTMKIIHSFYF